MIIGTGVDLVNITRFYEMPKDRLDRLAHRILTEQELDDYTISSNQAKYLAKVWAVKEAVAKSFGTGISGDIVWKNMQLRKSDRGQPLMFFKKELHQQRVQCHISISHDGDMVIATAVLSVIC
jgi:holo-[acyl-carrier protein] synthase